MKRSACAAAAAALAALLVSGCHKSPSLEPLPGTAHSACTITDAGVGLPSSLNSKGQIISDGGIEGTHRAHGYLLTPIGYKAARGNAR